MTRSRLRALVDHARAWPICLASAAMAYLTVTGLLVLLAPDIAMLIVNGVPTVKLILTGVGAFLFLNILLVLTYAASLFIIRRENLTDGLKKNGKKLVKGFILLSASSLACVALMLSVGYHSIFPTSLAQDALGLIAMGYGAGAIASTLFALPLVWLLTSLAGEGFRIGFRRLLSTIALFFLMLTILSAHGLPGLFTDSMLIPTIVSIVARANDEKAESKRNRLSWFKGRSIRKASTAIILTILVLSTEAPFNILISFGEETRFSEDRLKNIVSKAIAEGWSSGELASAIRSEPELSMLSTYDLSSISIERDDSGNVIVTIPLNAMGYAIYRRASSRTTVYDVYSQGGSGEVRVGDKRYVLTGYRSREETYGPFETLDGALARENEVKRNANATRIVSNAVLKTESREVTRVETRYAIVPTVRVARYEVLKEFETHRDAQNYLYRYYGMLETAEIREVEKQVWIHSYRLELVEETTSRHRALAMSRDGYVIEEAREKVTVYVFHKTAPVSRFHILGTVEIKKADFEKMIQTGELVKSVDEYGEEYYYYSSRGPYSARLYKTGERQDDGGVIAWRIYRRIDTSHWETRKAYQVVIQSGFEERKIGIGELPSYARGFPSKDDAEGSKHVVEQGLRSWVNSQGMSYKECEVASYEETLTRFEAITREVKQHYVSATLLKPVYDVYELRPYYRAWNETHYEERWGWVFKGHVDEKPENYDMSTWIYSPEVVNWTSKTYLGIVTELEAQLLTSMDPRYTAEKHNKTTVTREIAYYDVYNATWRLLYRHYKYIVHPLYEHIADGNVSSGGGWGFESIGDASGEICSSTHRSSPSSLRIVSRNGRGAWRQTFYFDAGGSNPTLDFWFILRGSGAVAVKRPDGSAHVFALGGSSGWSRFLRSSGDTFNQAGYYTISFIASENSELYVDDVSVHVGGYGEWVYQGDVENKPDSVPPSEKYEAFYRIENKRFVGTFEESVVNQYPTPPYIKEFNKKERVSYTVDLYKLYRLEGGLVRYKVFHWGKYMVPIVVRKEETGARWYLAESSVETDAGGRVLIESNVPESVVREKYSDPTKYYLAPRVIGGGEALELVCETLDENLAKKYEDEGYVVKSTRISLGSPVRFSMRVLQASIERNELAMLGKQNILKVAIANPTGDTLTYQVVIQAENTLRIEDVQLQTMGVVKSIAYTPFAEPSSWLIPVPPDGASYSLAFTAWVREVFEGEHGGETRRRDDWPGGQVGCSFVVKVLRNGRLVSKQRLLETFENFDVGRVIARHPFETVGGFLAGFASAAGMTVMWLTPGLQPLAAAITAVGLAWSTVNSFIVYSQTGSIIDALTVSPLGVVVAPIRALADPTMDDAMRARIIGAMVGVPLGAFVGRQVALDVAMLRMPSELRNNPNVYSKLIQNERLWGTPIASVTAESIGKLYPYLDVPDPQELVTTILSGALASRQDAIYIGSVLKWMAGMDKGFLSQHAGNLMEYLGSPLLRGKLGSLLSLSPDEALSLSQSVRGDFVKMLRLAEFKAAWEQLAKLGPDVARIISLSTDGIEVGVEKSLAAKLYPGIQRGTVVEFEFARGDFVFKGLLAYVKEKTVGDEKYFVFAFKAEERIPAIFELLKEDVQSIKVVPSSQVEKAFGLNAFKPSGGKLSMDRGSLRMDGSVRFSDGMVLRLDDPSIRLVPSENPLETGMINEMLLGGRIGGTSIVVGEDGVAKAFYGGSYLPAVVTANALGLQLGLLARPSGEALTITQIDLAQRGITDLGLLSIFYPNGETSTIIYTGGTLQAPLHSYPSGAFVGVQAVETRVVWTGMGKKAFYEQVASTSELLGSILGRGFKEELLKTVLLSSLTDAQVLDIVNTLAKNVEWLKALSGGRRIELVRRITDYIEKGDTAEEAIERVKRESEEFVKSLMVEASMFCGSISDAQLVSEIIRLLNYTALNLGLDSARRLLDLLKEVYSKALLSRNKEVANSELRSIVEKILDNLNQLEEVLAKLNSFDFREEPHRIMLRKGRQSLLNLGESNKVKPGTYAVMVHWEYGEKSGVMEFSIVKGIESDQVSVPQDEVDWVLSQIGSDEAKVLITKVELFDYRLFFPTKFSIDEVKIRLDLFNNKAEIDGRSYKFAPYTSAHTLHKGIRIDTEFEGRNIEGKKLMFSFYQDGGVKIRYGKEPYSINKIEFDIVYDLMKIEYTVATEKKTGEYSFNLKSLSEQTGMLMYKILLKEDQVTIALSKHLFRLLGYDALEELKSRIIDIDEDRKVVLLIHFDNNMVAYCGSKELLVRVPEGAKSVTSIELVMFKDLVDLKELAARIIENPANTHWKGQLGETITENYLMDGILIEISRRTGIAKEKLEVVWHGEKEQGKMVPDFEIRNAETGEYIALVEVKYVSSPENVEDFVNRLNEARDEIVGYMSSQEWGCNHGVIVVISWSPHQILSDSDIPPKVGDFDNPYIEYISKEGDKR